MGDVLKWGVLAAVVALPVGGILADQVPPLAFWVSLETLAFAVIFVLGFILSVLGLTMTSWPKHWIISLMALASLALFLGAWAAAKQAQEMAFINKNVVGLQTRADGLQENLKTLQSTLTAENNYAYVHSRNGQKQDGKFLLVLQGVGYTPSVSIELYSLGESGEKKLVGRVDGLTNVSDENVNFGPPLLAGKWEYDFRSQFSNWDQVLILQESDGVLVQIIEIRRRGEISPIYEDIKTYPIKEAPGGSR